MKDRIMFMVIDNRVIYLKNDDYDHREWYNALKLDPNNFENIIRGYVIKGKIIFFKGLNYNYDKEVIDCALEHASEMKKYLKDENLEIWCGILFNGSYGNDWESVYHIKDEELKNKIVDVKEEVKEEEKPKERIIISKLADSLINFKNDINDERFIKTVILDSIITLIITIILKIILSKLNMFSMSNFSDFLLVIIQVGLLILSIISYMQKKEFAKYIGVVAGLSLCFTFHIVDILLGIHYALFNINYDIYIKIGDYIHNIIEKLKKKK